MNIKEIEIEPIKKVFMIKGFPHQYTYDHRTKRITRKGRRLSPTFEQRLKEAIKNKGAIK